MTLPIDFRFSQASLRDFLACPRRFQLRHLRRLAWPAIEAEPYLERERHIKRGALFHRLAEQLLNGIPESTLTPLATANGLADWWQAFLDLQPALPEGERKPEWTISLPLGTQRLVAKFDLLIIQQEGGVAIYDWKTSTVKPRPESLREDIQTRLYRMAASETLGKPPEQINLTYWYAAFPQERITFAYNQPQFERDRTDLLELTSSIAAASEDSFVLTDDERQCRFCIYRSYCERGTAAGSSDGLDEDTSMEYEPESFDFNQVGEVAF